MANKVLVDLRGWVAVAESPHWFTWLDGPTTKNEQCSQARMQIFGSQSKKGRRGVIWHARSYFSPGLFLQQGRKIAIIWSLFAHVYQPVCRYFFIDKGFPKVSKL